MLDSRNMLAIDPSINQMGWALFTSSGQYLMSGTWSPERDTHPDSRVSQMLNWFAYVIPYFNIGCMAMEMPDIRSAFRGMRLLVFGQALGCVETVALLHNLVIYRISVKCWKGNAKKGHNESDFLQIAKRAPFTSHERDAVGVGAYLIRVQWNLQVTPTPTATPPPYLMIPSTYRY